MSIVVLTDLRPSQRAGGDEQVAVATPGTDRHPRTADPRNTQTSREAIMDPGGVSFGVAGSHSYSDGVCAPTRGTTTAPAGCDSRRSCPPNSVKTTIKVPDGALYVICHRKDVDLDKSRECPGQRRSIGSLPLARAPRAPNERRGQQAIPARRSGEAATASSWVRARYHSLRTQHYGPSPLFRWPHSGIVDLPLHLACSLP